ncbi:MAG: anthranilate phosphoribosyltransferase [Hyphomicrobiaceae bacterium]
MTSEKRLRPFIETIAGGGSLSADDAATAFDCIMSGGASPVEIAALLMGLRVKGETVDEITGAARVMRAKAVHVEAPADAIDTCGTGGDAQGTYNISTAAALVTAGAGVPVAKHGNRSVSSKSGSADVLAALGVKLDIPPERVAQCIREARVGFMFAPAHHAAMRHVVPVRQELAIRTIFNLLGPLSNPAGAKRQVIGVYARDWVEPLAKVLRNLGAERVWVVHGSDGLDEITTTGPTDVAELAGGAVRTFTVTPAEAGLPTARAADLKGGDAAANAEAIRALLAGAKGPFRDVVVINAAAALVVSGRAADLAAGARLAEGAIDGGAARTALDRLVTLSNA